jgi:hypothetical protein
VECEACEASSAPLPTGLYGGRQSEALSETHERLTKTPSDEPFHIWIDVCVSALIAQKGEVSKYTLAEHVCDDAPLYGFGAARRP